MRFFKHCAQLQIISCKAHYALAWGEWVHWLSVNIQYKMHKYKMATMYGVNLNAALYDVNLYAILYLYDVNLKV